ncbi:PEP-CTERM sorting domain-containing protein [Planctomycetota bacterium]|nr:PEP-CTERM sorting domain-containing protein [Planctomycetota bacterium]
MNNWHKSIAAGLCLSASTLFTSATASANIDIVFDYTFDTLGFFDLGTTFADGSTGAERRARLEEAASYYENVFQDTLAPITGGTWNAEFSHPGTGSITTVSNPIVGQDQVLIYAGGRNFSGSTLGRGGSGGFPPTGGTASFLDALVSRGEFAFDTAPAAQTDFASWGGSLTFDTQITNGASNYNWFWGDANAEVPAQVDNGPSVVYDFLSVAIHEIGHVLGFGGANSWDNLITNNEFFGTASMGVFGGPVPIDAASQAHWEADILGDSTAMDPSLSNNSRALLSMLDYAGFDDIGWEVDYAAIPEPASLALLALGSLTMLRRKRA